MDYSQTGAYHNQNISPRAPVTYPQPTHPQIIQNGQHNRAAAIIDTDIAISYKNNQHRPIMNSIQTNNCAHTPYILQQLQSIGLSPYQLQQIIQLNMSVQLLNQNHKTVYTNNNSVPRNYEQKEMNDTHNRYNRHNTCHKFDKYNKCNQNRNNKNYAHNKYEKNKNNNFNRFEKCRNNFNKKYHKYNKKKSEYNRQHNMRYYNDHSQRDRDRNSRVVAFSTTNIYINGIPRHWNYAQVQDYFGKYGTILSINLWRDHSTGYSRGSGFIDFKNSYSAQKCIKEMKNIRFNKCKPLIIKYADIRNQKNEVRRHAPIQNRSRTRSRSRSRDKRYNECDRYDRNERQNRSDKYERYESNNNKGNQQKIDYGTPLKLVQKARTEGKDKSANKTENKEVTNKMNESESAEIVNKDFVTDNDDTCKSPSIVSICSNDSDQEIETGVTDTENKNEKESMNEEYVDTDEKEVSTENKELQKDTNE